MLSELPILHGEHKMHRKPNKHVGGRSDVQQVRCMEQMEEEQKMKFDLREMNKLEAVLKNKGAFYKRIPLSEDGIKEQIVVYSPTDGRRIWDAVIGLGTYGSRAGLLELMWEDSGEVIGYLTAEGVIRETKI